MKSLRDPQVASGLYLIDLYQSLRFTLKIALNPVPTKFRAGRILNHKPDLERIFWWIPQLGSRLGPIVGTTPDLFQYIVKKNQKKKPTNQIMYLFRMSLKDGEHQ